MSAAEQVQRTVARPKRRSGRSVREPRPVSSRFLRSELRLIFGRRRNIAGLGVLAAVPVLMSVAVKVSGSAQGGPNFFSSITENGLFVALASLTVELGLFLPIAVAAISADTVAGEANLGTLRCLLTVPVRRTRLLAVKYAAIVLFSFAATFLVAATGVVMGLVLFGGGSLTSLSGSQIGFWAGVLRVVIASAYVSSGIASLGALGLFVSTLTEQPIGATIAIVLISTASFIADTIPQLDWLHPYLITHYWEGFTGLFRDPIDWSQMQHGWYVALAYAVVFWLAGWARFAGKDVTS
jgi:ABC-2 type transport system permease protein